MIIQLRSCVINPEFLTFHNSKALIILMIIYIVNNSLFFLSHLHEERC